jgi:hypothetical protein
MGNPRDKERIVEAIKLPTRFDAENAARLLSQVGIAATVASGDAGGWMPHFSGFHGHRVLVFESDLEEALAVFEENDL